VSEGHTSSSLVVASEQDARTTFTLGNLYGGVLLLRHINFKGYYFSPIYRTFAIRQGLTVPGGLDTHPS